MAYQPVSSVPALAASQLKLGEEMEVLGDDMKAALSGPSPDLDSVERVWRDEGMAALQAGLKVMLEVLYDGIGYLTAWHAGHALQSYEQ